MINKKYFLLIIPISLMVFLSFRFAPKKFYNKKEYLLELVTNNQLSNNKEFNGLNFKVTYKPPIFCAIQEMGSYDAFDNLNSKNKSIILTEYENPVFTFTISNTDDFRSPLYKGLSDRTEFYDRLEHFAFGIKSNLKLITDSDTLSPQLCEYERTYNTGAKSTFSILFPIPKSKGGDYVIQYNDQLFKNGILNFRFSESKRNLATF